jgi:RNA polymerase sigma factor (sigma-70 family)
MATLQEPSTDSRIERARHGSRSAMNRLLASCRPVLRGRAKARQHKSLAGKEDDSDLVQECQCQAVDHFGEFRGNTLAEFRKWICTILDRVIIQKRRYWARKKRDRKKEQPLAPDGGVPGEPAGSTTSILGQLARKEELEQLMVAASWCREEDQAVIFRHLFEDRSYEEIAAEWGVTCVVVRQRFSRALSRFREAKRLQELMTEYGMTGHQQEVIGIHRFQRASAATIAARLELPERLVAHWLDEARPLIRELDEDKS